MAIHTFAVALVSGKSVAYQPVLAQLVVYPEIKTPNLTELAALGEGPVLTSGTGPLYVDATALLIAAMAITNAKPVFIRDFLPMTF